MASRVPSGFATPAALYKPVDSSKYEIRLLQISFSMLRSLGQEDPTPLTARLVHHTLPLSAATVSKQFLKAVTRKHYTALSYVWGEPTLSEEIIVDGHRVPITYSLYSALRQLQCDAFGEESIWVDAICINQADDAEKSAQIRNMREVYHNAGNVRVWLGSAKGTNDQIFETMRYVTTLHNDYLPDKYPEGYEWWETNLLPPALRPVGLTAQTTLSAWHKINMFKETFKGKQDTAHALDRKQEHKFFQQYLDFRPKAKYLEKFLALVPDGDLAHVVNAIEKYLIADPEWFNRIWTVQEVGVAWDDIDVCRGPYNISWDSLVKTILYLHFTCNARFPSIDKILRLEIIRLGFREGKRKFLRELMYECRFRRATNPRDKIYGLYGLMNDGIDEFLKPDYTKGAEEVFARTTLHFVRNEASLDPILGQQKVEKREGLPSWVPDYELDLKRASESLVARDGSEKIFHASGHDERSKHVLEDPTVSLVEWSTLSTRGIQTGRIAFLSEEADEKDDVPTIRRLWRKTLDEYLDQSTLDETDGIKKSLDDLGSLIERYYNSSSAETKPMSHTSSFSTSSASQTSTPSSSTTTLLNTLTTSSPDSSHPIIDSYLSTLLTGRLNPSTRLPSEFSLPAAPTPALPPRPSLPPSNTSSSSASTSRPTYPSKPSSRTASTFSLDTSLHKAFGSSKTSAKSSAGTTLSTASTFPGSFSRLSLGLKDESRDKENREGRVGGGEKSERKKVLEEIEGLKKQFERSMKYRRFFVMEDGEMGCADKDIRVNDVVVVLFGASVPVILRDASRYDSEEWTKSEGKEDGREEMGREARRYKIISEAYTHGFMDGEVLAYLARGRWKAGIQDFILI